MKSIVYIVCLVGCAGEVVSTTQQPAIATNAIATNAIATNAIATNGILRGNVGDPAIQLALEDPNARVFMRYLVGCALRPDQVIDWKNHDGSLKERFTGNLGLCPKWQQAGPDQTCRERVSACILARNNAFGVSVAFSMRGHDGTAPLALGDHVPAHDHVPGTNHRVRSLERCRVPMLGDRNCGWSAASIGVCVPGEAVALAAGNYARCGGERLGAPSTNDMMLLVCDGISACDRRAAIAFSDDACGSAAPSTDFTCPASGLYAVMTAPADSQLTTDGVIASSRIEPSLCTQIVGDIYEDCEIAWDATCEKIAETACRYPAAEMRVFRWREGSFYGNLFGEESLDPNKPQVRVDPVTYRVQSQVNREAWIDDGGALSASFLGVAFPSMYACASSNWKQPEAYALRRVCAGPDPQDPTKYTRDCAASYAGLCGDVCDTLDAAPISGDVDAADCNGWKTPMTTLLAQPCDAVTDASCATVSITPILAW